MNGSDLTVNFDCGKLNVRVAALIKKGTKVLLEKGNGSPYYVLPGGRVKFGERAEDAVVREMKEELGVNVSVIRCLYVHQNFFTLKPDGIPFHEIAFYFLVDAPDSLLERNCFRTLDGKSTFSWVEVEQLKNMRFYPECLKRDIDCLPNNTILETEYDTRQ